MYRLYLLASYFENLTFSDEVMKLSLIFRFEYLEKSLDIKNTYIN